MKNQIKLDCIQRNYYLEQSLISCRVFVKDNEGKLLTSYSIILDESESNLLITCGSNSDEKNKIYDHHIIRKYTSVISKKIKQSQSKSLSKVS